MRRYSVIYWVLFLFSFGVTQASEAVFQLQSLSSKLEAEVRLEGQVIAMDLYAKREKMVTVKSLQFELEKTKILGDWRIVRIQQDKVNQTWQPIYGERSCVVDRYQTLSLALEAEGNGKRMTFDVRLYDEGLAFRYGFDELDFWNDTLTGEQTQFLFEDDKETWVTSWAQGGYVPTTLQAMEGEGERPQVVRVDANHYVAIGEAALVDYARMKLVKCSEGVGIQSVLSGSVSLDLADYRSPWRYVMVAGNPGELVQNNDFILNLNEPNQIPDTHWIKPGQVLREVTLTTAGALAAIDFAAENHIAYVEFDAGWYGPEEDEASDATRVSVDPARSQGPLDLPQVIAYADTKQVGILLYVNKKALYKQLDEILPLYQQWGVKGVKFGFVDVGDQHATAWLHQAIRKAARYQLMVDVHDEYRPTGYSRTYPNLMTQEGIRGDEESPDLTQTIFTFYNRMIAGAGDYTNCFFAERVTEKMGGRAAQLAKRVVIYSPWQFVFWYDRPYKAPTRAGGAGAAESVIRTDAVTDFYCSIPTTWDDSRFLAGEMGKYAVVARRSKSDWYVGVLNASGDKRQVVVPLEALGISPHGKVVLYYQPSAKSKDKVAIKEWSLKGEKELKIEVEADSGCVLLFSADK